ncbi:MAG: hypothetical protein A2Y12_05535 [Planctomycetes bacterium GWF2_42_9]|nr:MAG: hypothetical protein A2Y12_05535 [Planctomycetes bacterium GWF2_42_9]
MASVVKQSKKSSSKKSTKSSTKVSEAEVRAELIAGITKLANNPDAGLPTLMGVAELLVHSIKFSRSAAGKALEQIKSPTADQIWAAQEAFAAETEKKSA